MPQTHILQHKSWHVYNRDNVARVRRDEENARKEQRELQARADIAQAEYRVDQLRRRAQQQRTRDGDARDRPLTESEHIDDPAYPAIGPAPEALEGRQAGKRAILFEEGTGVHTRKGNAEVEREQQKALQDWEKKVGITTYLGQSSLEQASEKPWYLIERQERGKRTEAAGLDATALRRIEAKQALEERRQQKHLERLDPMAKSLQRKKQRHNTRNQGSSPRVESTKAATTNSETKGKRSVEEMRRKRLERERREKNRTAKFLSGPTTGPSDKTWQYSNQYMNTKYMQTRRM